MRHLTACVLTSVLAAAPATASSPIRPDGIAVQSSLEATDRDSVPFTCDRSGDNFFRDAHYFEAAAGQTVDITLVSTFDGYLYLFDSDDTEVARNDDSGATTTSRITTVLPRSDTYRVIVTSFSAAIIGNYTLSVTAGAVQTGSSDDSPISLGQTVTGSLVAGDAAPLGAGDPHAAAGFLRDGHLLEVPGREGVQIDLVSDFDGYLLLVDPGGRVIATNDDWQSTRSSRITAVLGAAGAHRIIVTSFREGMMGNYTLSVTPSGAVQSGAPSGVGMAAAPNLSLSPDTPLRFDEIAEGTLAETDNAALPTESTRAGVGYYRDGYAFDGLAGDPVQIDFTSRPASAESVAPGLAPLTPSLDGYLVLVAPSGIVEMTNDDFTGPTDARIETMLAESGTYRIVVTSFGPNATGRYRLSLTTADLASSEE